MAQRVAEYRGFQLEWVQPKAGERVYELRAGEETLGTLTFRSAWGSLAFAESADGQWSFKRVGFLNPRVTIRVLDSPEDAAIYQPKFWGGGVVTFAGGRAFAWKSTNFWTTDWAFSDPEGRLVLNFKRGIEAEKLIDQLFKQQATVDLGEVEAYGDLLPILIPLGMYLIILHQQDTAAIAATA